MIAETLGAPRFEGRAASLGTEQDRDQALSAVEAAPQVILLAPGTIKERAEVALSNAGQLGLASRAQQRGIPRAHAHYLHVISFPEVVECLHGVEDNVPEGNPR